VCTYDEEKRDSFSSEAPEIKILCTQTIQSVPSTLLNNGEFSDLFSPISIWTYYEFIMYERPHILLKVASMILVSVISKHRGKKQHVPSTSIFFSLKNRVNFVATSDERFSFRDVAYTIHRLVCFSQSVCGH